MLDAKPAVAREIHGGCVLNHVVQVTISLVNLWVNLFLGHIMTHRGSLFSRRERHSLLSVVFWVTRVPDDVLHTVGASATLTSQVAVGTAPRFTNHIPHSAHPWESCSKPRPGAVWCRCQPVDRGDRAPHRIDLLAPRQRRQGQTAIPRGLPQLSPVALAFAPAQTQRRWGGTAPRTEGRTTDG